MIDCICLLHAYTSRNTYTLQFRLDFRRFTDTEESTSGVFHTTLLDEPSWRLRASENSTAADDGSKTLNNHRNTPLPHTKVVDYAKQSRLDITQVL